MTDESNVRLPNSWRQLWSLFSEQERSALISRLLTSFQAGTDLRNAFLVRFARGVNFRPQTLMRWGDEQLHAFMTKNALRGFGTSGWAHAFEQYFLQDRYEQCERLRQSLNLPVGDQGEEVLGRVAPAIEPEAAAAAIEHMLLHFAAREVGLLVAWLRLRDASWVCLGDEWLKRDGEPAWNAMPSSRPPPATKEDRTGIHLDGFTTLDRVLIDQVVATISRIEGSLSHAQLEDLLETVIALNSKRTRSNFHLGFMDAVLPGRTPKFHRPEFNDERRAWYLAGVLFGYRRVRDDAAIKSVLIDHSEDFRRAAASPRIGELMAKGLLTELVDLHRVGDAAWIVERNAHVGGVGHWRPVLDKATELLRRGDVADAAALLRPLQEKYEPAEDDEADDVELFSQELRRRSAQLYQAQGDFARAEALLVSLVEELDGNERARVLADLGLVAGHIRRIFDLTLPNDGQEREERLASLKAGEHHFQAAATSSPQVVVAAAIALGMRCYLEWTEGDNKDDALRDTAIDWLQHAVTGMRGADAAPSYEQSGLLGQTLFMLAVLLMHRLSPIDSAAAMDAWAEITPAAGTFPLFDIKGFLLAAEIGAPAKIATIAEAVWRYRPGDALEIVSSTPELLARSSYLRDEVAKRAKAATGSHQERFRLWAALTPALLHAHDVKAAEEGLDEMERLCDSPALEREMLSYLSTRGNYDPTWDECDALWARTRLARRVGDDAQAAHYLNELFYLRRDDKRSEAADIVALFEEWRLDDSMRLALEAALPRPDAVTDVSQDCERRMRDGEPVKVLFVGGNETQERYDAVIQQKLHSEYPGLTITFRHTGWTSNWGVMLDGLVREANTGDAVVLMTMMRTMLGRSLRARLRKPWISCATRGEQGLRMAIRKAALIGLEKRLANVRREHALA